MDYETIYHDNHRRVYSICLRMLRNHEEAEDLTQETFLQVYKKLHTFKGNSALSSWIHRVAVNQVLMYMRLKRKRMQMKEVEITESEFNIPAPIVNPNISLLDWAVNQLSPGYRTHLILHDYLGYEHAEVAKVLGITDGTAKSQIFKARAKMRKLLNKKCNPRVIFG